MQNSDVIYYHGRRVNRTKFYGNNIFITDNKKYAKLYSDGSDIYCFKIPHKTYSKIFSILNQEHFNDIKDTIHPYALQKIYKTISDGKELEWTDTDVIGSGLDDDFTIDEILSEKGYTGIFLTERENIVSIMIFNQNDIDFIGMETFEGYVNAVNELQATSYGMFTNNYRGISATDPGISFEPYNRHYQTLQSTYKRLNDINTELTSTSLFQRLKNELILGDQQVENLKIIRIIPNNANIYNAYIEFTIAEKEYDGVIYDVVGPTPTFKSNVFKSGDLVLTKEWVVRLSGHLIKVIRNWISPDDGEYVSLKGDMLATSITTGRFTIIDENTLIKVVGTDEEENRVYIEVNSERMFLSGKNYIYFNYYFEPVEK